MKRSRSLPNFLALIVAIVISSVCAASVSHAIPISWSAPSSWLPHLPWSPPGVGHPLGGASSFPLQGCDTVPLSSGMFGRLLPRFSGMDYGFLYEFSSKGTNRTQLFADTVLPLHETPQEILFTQAHFGYNRFSQGGSVDGQSLYRRMDVSVGGAYRLMVGGPTSFLGCSALFGVNGFWDASEIFGSWYNSYGFGLEMALERPDNGVLDLSINQYGNQFQNLGNDIALWRNGPANYDIEAGLSQGLYDGMLDVRLKMNAYQFSVGDDQLITGYKGGVELMSGNGVLMLAYEMGSDADKGTYNTVSASLNVGFQAENLLRGQNPFSRPQPVFRSPQRNPRRILNQKVRRNTNLPDRVVVAKRTSNANAAGSSSQPHFQLAANGPYTCASGVYQASGNCAGTWTITYVNNAGTLEAQAGSYTIILQGNTDRLTFPLTARITPSCTDPSGTIIVRQDGAAGAETVTFNSSTDLVKTVPADGNSGGATAVPIVRRPAGSGTGGSQGNIAISAPGVQTLTAQVTSANDPARATEPHFQLAVNGPYASGSGTYTQSGSTSGSWNITPVNNAGTLQAQAASYTVTLVGSTTGLTFPLRATITPSATQPTGRITVRQDGAVGAQTVTFNSPTDLVKTIPAGAGTAVPNVTRTFGSGTGGSQGSITISATGVQTLTAQVVSSNEPTQPGQPHFQLAVNGPYGFGSGTYTQSGSTSGTWNITPVNNAGTLQVQAASYTVTLAGDTSGLTFPFSATITPGATQPTGAIRVRQDGAAGAESITFNSATDLVQIVPSGAGTAVPIVTRTLGSGTSGSQGSITISATGVQTLTAQVVSSNEPTQSTQPYFQLAINSPYNSAGGTYAQAGHTYGTWNVSPVNNAGTLQAQAASYTVTLAGDTSGLTFPLTATITPNATQPTGAITVRQGGGAGAETVTFSSATDLVKSIPSDGLSGAGTSGPSVTRTLGTGTNGSQGTITISAAGVQTLTAEVVITESTQSTQPYFQLAVSGPYGYGSGKYTQSGNTSGTWDITYVNNNGTLQAQAAYYTVTLMGDVSGLTFPFDATITPTSTQPPTGAIGVRQDGAAGVETIRFNTPTDLVKTILPNGMSGGAAAVPNVTRTAGTGTNGIQGTITVAAAGVQTLTAQVVSAETSQSTQPHFELAINGPYGQGSGQGSGTYTQSGSTAGTWNITPVNNAGTLQAQATSYTVTLVGDTSRLTFPLTAAVDPKATQPTGQINVRQDGTANSAEFITFNSPTDLVKTVTPTVPPGIPGVTRTLGYGTSGSQGSITIGGAAGVQTLTVQVVSSNEPTAPTQPYFELAMNTPYMLGSGTYVQPGPTYGTWNVTPELDTVGGVEVLRSQAASYTVTLKGDVSGLTFPLTATITPSATQPTGQIAVRQDGGAAAETVTFPDATHLVQSIPPNGSLPGGFAVPFVARTFGQGTSGIQGAITISAAGVQTLTAQVVSSNEPTQPSQPHFELAINGSYVGDSANPQSGAGYYQNINNTSGIWYVSSQAGATMKAGSYTITLSGNTSNISWPLVVTVTGKSQYSSGTISVDPDGSSNTTTFNLWPNDLVYTVSPNPPNNGVPICTIQGPNPGELQGNITISAPGVQTFTLAIITTSPHP